ncbi:MAG: hypothetical protein NUV86_12790 [Candidatus Scalindua sp.]|nr:hypothetical protein [Candidatus Scalindua sp.]
MLNKFTNQMVSFRDSHTTLEKEINELRKSVKKHILAIPCELDTEVLDAGSPFTSYIKIRSIIETANKQLIFVDPYMGQGTIRRFFNNIPENVCITVITK